MHCCHPFAISTVDVEFTLSGEDKSDERCIAPLRGEVDDAFTFGVKGIDSNRATRIYELEGLRRGLTGPSEIMEKSSATAVRYEELRDQVARGVSQENLLQDGIEKGV